MHLLKQKNCFNRKTVKYSVSAAEHHTQQNRNQKPQFLGGSTRFHSAAEENVTVALDQQHKEGTSLNNQQHLGYQRLRIRQPNQENKREKPEVLQQYRTVPGVNR